MKNLMNIFRRKDTAKEKENSEENLYEVVIRRVDNDFRNGLRNVLTIYGEPYELTIKEMKALIFRTTF